MKAIVNVLLLCSVSTILVELKAQASLSPSEFSARRTALAAALGPNAMFVALSAEPARHSVDVDWPFRQSATIRYLTGLTAPGTSLVLLPGEEHDREFVFAADRDPALERWTGRIASKSEVATASGVKDVRSAQHLERFLDAVLGGNALRPDGLGDYFGPPVAPAFVQAFRKGTAVLWLDLNDRGRDGADTLEQKLAARLRARYPELAIRDASPTLRRMREIKSDAEVATVQRAVDITVAAHRAAMRRVLTATREYQVEATIEHAFRDAGACCWAFPSIVAAGRNATTMHYGANEDPILPTDLVLMDIGAEVDGYAADVTRTIPARGRFTPAQRAIYTAVFNAQTESIAMMVPGALFRDVYHKTIDIVGRELLKLGLITTVTRDQVELYMYHSIGHPVGLATHDVFDTERQITPGMILTNEPGIYVRSADVLASKLFLDLAPEQQRGIRRALEQYEGLGVRIEDDILITPEGPRIMSAGAPRSAADIERAMTDAQRQ